MPMQVYPLLFELEGRRCLIVGGGRVARRRLTSLLSAGARVDVIADDETTRVYEVVELSGVPAIVSEFVAGVPLNELLGARPLTFREAAEFTDESYRDAGCEIAATAGDIYANSDIILKVRGPEW